MTTDQNVYNKIATSYAYDNLDTLPARRHMLYSTWLTECGDVNGKKVLDLGCGSGRSSRLLAQKGALVTGVDNSTAMLGIARGEEQKHSQGIQYVLGDLHQPLDLSETYDLVVAALVLHYAKTAKELKTSVANLANLTKSGGRIVLLNSNVEKPTHTDEEAVFVHNPTHWTGEPYKDGAELEVTLYGVDKEKVASFNICYWSKETLAALFEKHGFTNVQWLPLRVDDAGKKLMPNWRDVERSSTLMVISAVKV